MECDECNGEMNEYLPCDDCGQSFHEECREMIACKICNKTICSECLEEHRCQERGECSNVEK